MAIRYTLQGETIKLVSEKILSEKGKFFIDRNTI